MHTAPRADEAIHFRSPAPWFRHQTSVLRLPGKAPRGAPPRPCIHSSTLGRGGPNTTPRNRMLTKATGREPLLRLTRTCLSQTSRHPACLPHSLCPPSRTCPSQTRTCRARARARARALVHPDALLAPPEHRRLAIRGKVLARPHLICLQAPEGAISPKVTQHVTSQAQMPFHIHHEVQAVPEFTPPETSGGSRVRNRRPRTPTSAGSAPLQTPPWAGPPRSPQGGQTSSPRTY